MGDEKTSGGKIALKILKYIGLIPIILLFAILLTILPLISSIDSTMSQNISSSVIVVALEEGAKAEPDALNLIVEACETDISLEFENYTIPCNIVTNESWEPIAEYLVDTYPSTYYDLVPAETIGVDISEMFEKVGRPVIFVLIAVSLILMILFAKGNISSSLNYLSLGFLVAGVVYISLNTYLLSYLNAAGLPDFVSVLIPGFLPPRMLGYIYMGVSIFTKLIEVIVHALRK